MATETINIESQVVVQTAAQWAIDATVYSEKRILVTSDVLYTGTDQPKFKIANGVDTWANLDYMPDVNAAAAAALASAIAYAAPANSQLKATAVKTTNYAANAGEYVPVDTTSGVVAVTLPTNPVDGTIIGIKRIAGATNNSTYSTGTGDVLNISGGSTSGNLSVLNQQVTLIYKKLSPTTGIWYVETSLSLSSLDARFAPITAQFKQNTAGSHTGTVTETFLLASSSPILNSTNILIGDIFKIMLSCGATSNANNKIIRMYANTTPNLSGTPVLLATITFGASNNSASAFVRHINFISLTSQSIFPPTTSHWSDMGSGVNGVVTDPALNLSSNSYYIVYSAQLANTGDVIRYNYGYSEIHR